jgi:hypothetical protein
MSEQIPDRLRIAGYALITTAVFAILCEIYTLLTPSLNVFGVGFFSSLAYGAALMLAGVMALRAQTTKRYVYARAMFVAINVAAVVFIVTYIGIAVFYFSAPPIQVQNSVCAGVPLLSDCAAVLQNGQLISCLVLVFGSLLCFWCMGVAWRQMTLTRIVIAHDNDHDTNPARANLERLKPFTVEDVLGKHKAAAGDAALEEM